MSLTAMTVHYLKTHFSLFFLILVCKKILLTRKLNEKNTKHVFNAGRILYNKCKNGKKRMRVGGICTMCKNACHYFFFKLSLRIKLSPLGRFVATVPST